MTRLWATGSVWEQWEGRSVVRSGRVWERPLARSADGLGMKCKRSRGVQEGSEGSGLDNWKGVLPSTKTKLRGELLTGSSVVHGLFWDVSKASEWSSLVGRGHIRL